MAFSRICAGRMPCRIYGDLWKLTFESRRTPLCGRRRLSRLTSAATGNEAWRRRVEVLRDASRQLRTFKPEWDREWGQPCTYDNVATSSSSKAFISGRSGVNCQYTVGTVSRLLRDPSRTNRYNIPTNSSFMVTF